MGFLKRLALAVSGAALLATGLGTSPASALPSSVCMTVYNGTGSDLGEGCFFHHGDIFTVEDHRADGARVVAEWHTDYDRSGECHNAYGANDRTVTCNYNMKETGVVSFSVCVQKGATGQPITCSPHAYVSIGNGARL
ncbi:hypothetical protein ACL02R_07630 [Streptomyces sp. MS19]|uniref:hypothetical protein n=1 Tax=Streptomyces sp. MS19 TaxID=3385972 RepID=UPI00399F24EF